MQSSDAALRRPPLLLRGPVHEVTHGGASRDFQTRVGHPGVHDEEGCTPCVVVLTRTADREIDELSLRLAADGIPLLRMDSDRCLDIDVCWDVERGVLLTSAGRFRPRVSWVRYFHTSATAAGDDDPRSAAYARDQWDAWAPVMHGAHGVRAVNGPAEPGGLGRVAQLAQAQAVGLRTPATVVSTSLAEAARRIPGSGDLIVKSLGEHFVEPVPRHLTGLVPRRVSRRDALSEEAVEPAPVIVQELIPCARELRVYAVGGALVTFGVRRPSPEALWTAPDRLRADIVPTPNELQRPLRRLVKHWSLDVAAFDLLDTDSGPVFLEVNAACDWRWCESLAGVAPISAAVCALVADVFADERAFKLARGPR